MFPYSSLTAGSEVFGDDGRKVCTICQNKSMSYSDTTETVSTLVPLNPVITTFKKKKHPLGNPCQNFDAKLFLN